MGRYHEAVHAYERANELEPNNDSILQSLEIARKKDLEKSGAAAGGHGHSHGGAPGGMPDFSGLMNNPGVQNLVNTFQNQMQSGEGGPPNISEMFRNPEVMQQATQMFNDPAVGGLLNNPAVMNMASQMLSNPELLGNMMKNF